MTTREELYALVWAEPMTKVAAQFDVSSSYLARVCTILNVPRPERGYWSKLAVGKAPAPEALPPARPGDQLVWRQDEALAPPVRPRAIPKPRERRAGAKVVVPRAQVHPLIRGAKGHLLNTRDIKDGAYLRPFKKLLADITTSASCLDRAVDLANDLFNGLESVGHRVVIAPADERRWSRAGVDERETKTKERSPYYGSALWSPHRPTVAYIGELAVGLAILEMSEEVLLRYVGGKYIRESDYIHSRASRYEDRHTWTTTEALPSGRLRVVAFSPHGSVNWSMSWQESAGSSLKESIPKIVGDIEKAMPGLRAQLVEAERQAEIRRQEWAAAEERRRRAEDKRRIEESVRQSRDDLAQVIERWAAVMRIEQFFAGVEQRVDVLPDVEERAHLEERLKLARDFMGSQDPLVFFGAWKTPGERYHPVYAAEEGSASAGDRDED